jgi:hypothetical protein
VFVVVLPQTTDEVVKIFRNRRENGRHAIMWAPLLLSSLGGCAVRGAPSFVIVGSYFPGWMFCAVIGVISAIVVRVVFVASGLATVLPFQLFVCSAIGLCCGLFAWLLWFGQ